MHRGDKIGKEHMRQRVVEGPMAKNIMKEKV